MKFFLYNDSFCNLLHSIEDFLFIFVDEVQYHFSFVGYTELNDHSYMLFISPDDCLFIFEVTTSDYEIFAFSQVPTCSLLYNDIYNDFVV